MLLIALTSLCNIYKPQLYLNCKNLAKISPIAKVVICMKYQINFTISYYLCCLYMWSQLERQVFNYYIAFLVKVVPRYSIKLDTCCVACIHSTTFSSNIPPVLCGPLYSISVLPYNVLSCYAVLLKESIHLLLIKYKFPAVNCGFQHIIFSTLWLKPKCFWLMSIPDRIILSTPLTALHFLTLLSNFIKNSKRIILSCKFSIVK